MHYREAAANLLTNPALDPYAGIPEFKVCAVRIDPLVRDGRRAAAKVRTEREAVAGDD
jgi:predicted molibdopterin-dependent oxidoreductase YjgC